MSASDAPAGGGLADRLPLVRGGFRVFFPLAALLACVAIARTVLVLAGVVASPAGGPFLWHGHELIFGFLAAVIAGFLLTAVPNWTGTAPLAGWPLVGLAALWVGGRIAFWNGPPAAWGALVDLAFLPALLLVVAVPVVRRRNWRNLLPLGAVLLLALMNWAWHDARHVALGVDTTPALLVASLAVALLIAVIGGRITPAFTRNRLRATGSDVLPRPSDWRDHAAVALSAAVIPAAALGPAWLGWTAIAAAAAHALRLVGWCGTRVWREPLLFGLHLGYAWLVAGYAALGLACLEDALRVTWGLHALLAGAAGTMTLVVMSRASLGHTGRPFRAGILLTAALGAVQLAGVLRLLGPWVGPDAWAAAGIAWLVAYGLFLVRIVPVVIRPRVPAHQGPSVAARSVASARS